MMRWNYLEGSVACLLFGAATIGVASGVKLMDPPEEDAIEMVVEEESAEEPEVVEVAIEDSEREERLSRLIEEAQNASEEEKESKRGALKNALTEIFQKRTEAQRNRIAKMKEKLETIETQLEHRSNLEEQIVQRRMNELLGDKDELSWDHELEMELSSRKKSSLERTELDFPSEFPTEYPFEIVLERSQNARKANTVSESRKRLDAEMAARAASIAKANAFKANAEVYKAVADQAREVRSREQETKRASSAERNARLPNMGRLNGLEDKPGPEREQRVEQLRMQIETMRTQSKLLEKQLQEISKAKSK